MNETKKLRTAWREYDHHDNATMSMQELVSHIAQYLADIRDRLDDVHSELRTIANVLEGDPALDFKKTRED
jgi:chemotaxis regulatin CheY-phosphate phosphatase CheZ